MDFKYFYRRFNNDKQSKNIQLKSCPFGTFQFFNPFIYDNDEHP